MVFSIPRLSAVIVGIIAFSWLLPDIFIRATRTEVVHLSGQFSPVTEQFVIWQAGADSLKYKTEAGEALSSREARSLMPFVFAYDAAKWGLFPIEAKGERVDFEQAKNTVQMVRLKPWLWTGELIGLYPLFESQPEKAELELPPDVFRLKAQGIEFINAADGSINQAKSNMFSDAMHQAGVNFPVTAIGGNPNPRKSFDEGYFFTDQQGHLFQLKMVHGRPLCRDTGIMVPGKVHHIYVEEHISRKTYGYIVTDTGVFSIDRDDTLKQFPIKGFSANTDSISIVQMPVYYSAVYQRLQQNKVSPLHLMATDSYFSPVKEKNINLPDEILASKALMSNISSALFPVTIKQFSPLWNGPQLLINSDKNWRAHLPYIILGGIFCLVILLGVRHKKQQRFSVIECVIVFCSGLSGLLAVLIFGPLKRK